jgi:hypothetical protein
MNIAVHTSKLAAMPRVSRGYFALRLVLGALLLEVPVLAATPAPCVATRVSVVIPPGPEWQTATDQLAEHLRGLSDLDKCARLLVHPSGAGVVLEVTSNDGRETTRHADSVAELLKTAEALLVLPPQPRMAVTLSPLELPPPESSANSEATSKHVELGVGASLRFGGGPLYAGGGVAAFADFALDRWLLAVTARWDVADAFVNQPTPGDFSMASTSVGVSAGRRIELRDASLDALIGPNVVLESQETDSSDPEIHGAAADFRLALALRVSSPRSSSMRAFAAADFEASPARLRSQKYIDRSLPPLPWWSSGLAVGVLWGAR